MSFGSAGERPKRRPRPSTRAPTACRTAGTPGCASFGKRRAMIDSCSAVVPASYAALIATRLVESRRHCLVTASLPRPRQRHRLCAPLCRYARSRDQLHHHWTQHISLCRWSWMLRRCAHCAPYLWNGSRCAACDDTTVDASRYSPRSSR